MLWAPSWGGMLNGLLTLRGAWDKVRTDPVLKFFAAGVTFYGMATFEGPLLSIKSVNAPGPLHRLDHRSRALRRTRLERLHGCRHVLLDGSAALRDAAVVEAARGHALLARDVRNPPLRRSPCGSSGITQGLMWRATDAQGALVYPNFVETLDAIRPMYWMRLVGGTAYLAGMLLMAVNLAQTARAGKPVDGTIQVPVEVKGAPGPSWGSLVFGRPVVLTVVTFGLVVAFALSNIMGGVAFASTALVVGILSVLAVRATGGGEGAWHRLLEGRALLFTVLTLLAVLAGGVAELIPSLLVKPAESADARPYRALELEGRDLYIREGCYNCHSQMIRPFRTEQQRYGEPSTMADSQFDHPFQWGSKRTGPDLAREGSKYPNVWHYQHLLDPRAVSPGSNMPPYAGLVSSTLDFARTEDKLRAMRSVGVPYDDHTISNAAEDARAQAREIAADSRDRGRERATRHGGRRAHRLSSAPRRCRTCTHGGPIPGLHDAVKESHRALPTSVAKPTTHPSAGRAVLVRGRVLLRRAACVPHGTPGARRDGGAATGRGR